MEEIAIEDYRKLVMSQEPNKMHVLLQFVFDAEQLRESVREQWMELYDFQYIDDKIIGGIEKNLPNVSDILRIVEKKATGKVTSALSQSAMSQSEAMSDTQSQKTLGQTAVSAGYDILSGDAPPKKVTEMQPFNLTQPKPKVIPKPLALPREHKANPVPKNLFKKTVVDVERDKEERRKAKTEAIRKEYEENVQKRFELATEKRPTIEKFDRAKEELEQKFQSEVKFSGTKPRRMPNFEKMEAPVKLTAAAVKREALALKQAEEKEQKRLQDLEWN